jgi:hypothetical protein
MIEKKGHYQSIKNARKPLGELKTLVLRRNIAATGL